jgi:hypothetical protein
VVAPPWRRRQHVADRPAVEPVGGDVEQTQPGGRHAADAEEALPQDLIAGADAQHRGTASHGHGQGAAGHELGRRRGLLGVLAAAEQVDVAVPGHRPARVDGDHLAADAARQRPGAQHDRVAGVAVGAEQVRVQLHHSQQRFALCHNAFRHSPAATT